MAARTRMLTMRMNETERTRLSDVADHYGLSAADALRLLLKREEARLFGADSHEAETRRV